MTTTQDISAMTIPQLKAALTDLGVSFKAKDKKADLQVALENAMIAAAKTSETETKANTADVHEALATTAHHVVDRAAKQGVTGLHYRGRALGLKHYRAMGLAEGRTAPKRKRAAVSLPNSQRIQNYARQRGTVGAVTDSSPVATLTPKQMRRVRKHILGNLATDTIDIRCLKAHPKREGEALLALAPNGYGILHQFSN